MALCFIPARSFLGRFFSSKFVAPLSTHRYLCNRPVVHASISSRERRRAQERRRINVHKYVKQEIDNRETPPVNAIVSIPISIRSRCSLTHRLSKTRLFLDREDFEDVDELKKKMRSSLVRLYPELEDRRLLRPQDDFDIKVAGGPIVDNLDLLQSGVEKCEHAGTPVYVELIPHNIPPPKPPLSERVDNVKRKSLAVSEDANAILHMASFYKFLEIEDPERFSTRLCKVWSWMGVLGRVYVAKEGINAQLAIPDATIIDFKDAMNGDWIERGESVVPQEIVGVFLNFDRLVPRKEQPFEKLSVRPRHQILADGFQQPLNWNKSGKEISSDEWHSMLSEKDKETVVLDCRNRYESDVGHFEGAQLLNTDTFRETWEELEKRLEHIDRSTPVRTYCTGGIRCVKVNAYLEQKMGFRDTGRLEGGIVKYANTLRQKGKIKNSKFKGVNHVFDGRMGEVITDDLLHRCINCGQLSNVQTDCANTKCPRPFHERMFVQCEDCATKLEGACSSDCQVQLGKPESKHAQINSRQMDWKYADVNCIPESDEMREIREATEKLFPTRSRMLSGNLQASMLRMLAQIAGAKNILEIGTFTGYAAIAMAEGLPPNGRIVTCEVDSGVGEMAQSFFDKSINSSKISLRIGKAAETMFKLKNEGLKFEFVFVDADKGGYETYKNLLVETDILPVGGTVVFDNVLFRGEVAMLWGMPEEGEEDIRSKRLTNLVNVKRTAQQLKLFNENLVNDNRFQQVMLPLRDGLTIARRIK